nr:glutathione hydrolase 7-like [Anolis sagrei ordinatus]
MAEPDGGVRGRPGPGVAVADGLSSAEPGRGLSRPGQEGAQRGPPGQPPQVAQHPGPQRAQPAELQLPGRGFSISGGGVMLVHDIRKNESRVIDFRETAPFNIQEEGLRKAWETKPGLLVGVPGMVKGLHEAHQSYGRLPWRQLLGLAADVAQDGFNVTHDLAMAIRDVKEQHNYSDRFKEIFLPDGQPLLPGMFMRRPDLAALLHLLGSGGVSAFYSGNVTQEIISEVLKYGGTLSEEDFSNYTVLMDNPVHTIYQGHLVLSPSPPHVGPALITALNILEGFNITSQVARENILQWITEEEGEGVKGIPERMRGLATNRPTN